MPLFVLTCLDKPASVPLRMSTREAHLAYLAETGVVKIGGPFLDDAGQPCGSMLVIEADDVAAARAFGEADPYAKAGLFQSVDVRPFRLVVGQL
jgi:uncharacterized protein YciI